MASLSREKMFENSQVETVLSGGAGGEGSGLQWTCVEGRHVFMHVLVDQSTNFPHTGRPGCRVQIVCATACTA